MKKKKQNKNNVINFTDYIDKSLFKTLNKDFQTKVPQETIMTYIKSYPKYENMGQNINDRYRTIQLMLTAEILAYDMRRN